LAFGVWLWTAAAALADPLSGKRGFADVGANYDILQSVNAGWYYGWRPDKPGGVGNFDADFVPMIWGAHQANQFEIDRILGYGDVEWVLGFNEPERPDQANLTVSQAIAAWRTLSAGFTGTNVKLISPGVADTGGAGGGQQWLASFMAQADAENLKVDGVAFHWYGVSNPNDPIGAANSFISRVDSYHNSYDLPVWITEFAIHDWGGVYTDEEMRVANAIFLENVIPRLESRSYVGGYAFYNWFGDSRLVEGSPLTPTNVGVNYVGVIKTGEVYNFSNIDLGEHVAYLSGGELVYQGGAGRVCYINALANTSRLSGTANWGLSAGNWVRVQPGATLRKSSANHVTLDIVNVTNNGVIDVEQGELVMTDGRLVVGTGKIRVGEGGVLRFEGFPPGRGGPAQFDHLIELDGGTVAAPEVFGVAPLQNGVLMGRGVVSGGLVANTGSTVRVGETGLSKPSWSIIDNFESYAAGKLNAGVTGGVWTGVFDGTENAQIVSVAGRGGGKSLEYYGTGSSWRGARTSLRVSFSPDDHSLADGDTATYFFRLQRQGTQTLDGIFGLTDLEEIGIDTPWQELAITMSLFQGTGAGATTALRAFDNDGGGDIVVRNNIAANEWINVWLVVDNENKTFEVATSTGSVNGTLFPRTFNFGRQLAIGEALDTFAGAEFRAGSDPTNAAVRIDDLVYLAGENFTYPLNTTPGVFVESALLRVEGDYRAMAGSTLELDVFDPAAFDRLEVTGVLTADGTLQISRDAAAPDPEAGDAFNVLDFASATGFFDAFDLPELDAGLVWDVSQIYASGVLAVDAGLAGDYNGDGTVNAADYTTWRNSVGAPAGTLRNDVDLMVIGRAQYDTWKANYGTSLFSLGARAAAAVPEPSGFALIGLGGILLGLRRLSGPGFISKPSPLWVRVS
jgi:hypothetical protein